MSGIAAIIHFDGQPVAPGDIEAMTNSMAYRGPDGIGHHQSGNVALGHCLMCTTTESLEEVQPLVNARGDLWLVVDGWLGNWIELRAELLKRGVNLRNRTDAELILAAYELWGEDCVLHIEGDFAFVIWDARRQTVFCARDRMGNKPLNFYWFKSTLVIASEARAILALPWLPREVNEGLLAERLAGEWWSRSETLWTNLFRLVAAHRLTTTSAGMRMDRYWQPDLTAIIHYKTDEEYFEHYRHLFLDVVRRYSRSHRPVAYEVSGGLDSSAIFSVAKHLHDRQELPAPGIRGYTLDFSGDPDADELDYVRVLARFLSADIQEVAPTILPRAWYLRQALESSEQAVFPNSVMTHGINRMAIDHGSRVIVNGLGGDEWLEGTRAYYAEELAAWRLRNVVACLCVDARSIGSVATLHAFLRYGLFALLPLTVQGLIRRAFRQITGRRDPDQSWLSNRVRSIVDSRRPKGRPRTGTVVQADQLEMLHLAIRDWYRETDERLNSAFGLEARRPMDTPAMVQYAISTPDRLRLRGDDTKFTHRRALRGLLPPEILNRRTKAEFSVVIRELIDQLEAWFLFDAAPRFPEHLDQHGLVNLHQHYKRNPELGWPMWILWNIYGCVNWLDMADKTGIVCSETECNCPQGEAP